VTVAEGTQIPDNLQSRRKLTLAACCSVHGLQDGLSASLYVLLPIFAQAFGLTYAQIGIIRAANNAAMTLFEIPSGILSERLGERVLLAFGLLSAGVGFLLIPVTGEFWGLGACLFVVGMGAAFQHALSSSVISQSYPEQGRRSALGIYNSSGDAGKLIMTALCSFLIGIELSWQGVVLGYGVSAILLAVVLFHILYSARVGGPPPAAYVASAAAKPRSDWGIRDGRGFTVLSIIVFLVSLVQGTFLTFIAFVMIEKQVPAGLASLAVVLTLAGGMLGKFGCGFLAERFGIIRSLVLVQLLAAIGIVSVLISPTFMSFALLPILGIVLQGSSSITYATVGDLVHSGKQSRAFALIYSVGSGAAIVGPIGLGYIGDQYGLAPSMTLMAVIMLLPIPLCAVLSPSLAKRTQ